MYQTGPLMVIKCEEGAMFVEEEMSSSLFSVFSCCEIPGDKSDEIIRGTLKADRAESEPDDNWHSEAQMRLFRRDDLQYQRQQKDSEGRG